MDILTAKQVNDAFLKIRDNAKLISDLTHEQTVEVLELIKKKMTFIEDLHSQVNVMDFGEATNTALKYGAIRQSYDINNVSDYKALKRLRMALERVLTPEHENVLAPELIIEKEINVSDKVCDMWCYAYFHLIWEREDQTKALPMFASTEIARISNELYKIDGGQFYNQYHPLCKLKLVDSIRSMNPKRREKLKTAIFKLAEIHNSPIHVRWWNINII